MKKVSALPQVSSTGSDLKPPRKRQKLYITINLDEYNMVWWLEGQTFSVQSELKKAGGTWNYERTRFEFPFDKNPEKVVDTINRPRKISRIIASEQARETKQGKTKLEEEKARKKFEIDKNQDLIQQRKEVYTERSKDNVNDFALGPSDGTCYHCGTNWFLYCDPEEYKDLSLRGINGCPGCGNDWTK